MTIHELVQTARDRLIQAGIGAHNAALDAEVLARRVLGWDRALKSRGINPGTSADLTVATLFAAGLSSRRPDKCAAAILPSRPKDD